LERKREAEGILTNSITGSPIKRSSSDFDPPGPQPGVGAGGDAASVASCGDENSREEEHERIVAPTAEYGGGNGVEEALRAR